MKLHGTLLRKTPIENVGKDQSIPKQSFIIQEITEKEEKYPNVFLVDFIKDKVEWSNRIQVGQEVEVNFGSKVSEYNGKNYGNLIGFSIKAIVNSGQVYTDHGVEDFPF